MGLRARPANEATGSLLATLHKKSGISLGGGPLSPLLFLAPFLVLLLPRPCWGSSLSQDFSWKLLEGIDGLPEGYCIHPCYHPSIRLALQSIPVCRAFLPQYLLPHLHAGPRRHSASYYSRQRGETTTATRTATRTETAQALSLSDNGQPQWRPSWIQRRAAAILQAESMSVPRS